MLNIKILRKLNPKIILIGNYPPIIQSMLDYDYLIKKDAPSIIGIAETNKSKFRYFWGNNQILIPGFKTLEEVPSGLTPQVNLFLNVLSARKILATTETALEIFPNLLGGVIFAENTPESHSIKIYDSLKSKNCFIVGPSSVGILIPGNLKLGAIGGVDPNQLTNSVLHESGNVAVFSASGGMTNELINIISSFDKRISFSLSFGGDRFPVFTPAEAFLTAEKDPQTTQIIYFGELGGYDEYELADLISAKKITKPVISYIAGRIADEFTSAPQFGHAKAMARQRKESALEKTEALKKVGIITSNSFKEFLSKIKNIPSKHKSILFNDIPPGLLNRKQSIFASSISRETDTGVEVLGEDLGKLSHKHSLAYISASLLLGKKIKSKEFEQFTDIIFKLLVDNGPSVSGAITTIISARAGKDLVSSLAAGLLTVGKRFGGAINQAAENWIYALENQLDPFEFVKRFSDKGEYIAGIGHKKYRIDKPDPRVHELIEWSQRLKDRKYITYAKKVETVTTAKKANLILNVDGTIAAILLDILREKESLGLTELKELVDIEFFNAFFVIPRSVGFIAHYLDQKRLDEGLFRLPGDEVAFIEDK